MEEDLIYQKLMKVISETITLFQTKPYFFLNEHDVQAFLYGKLRKKLNLKEEKTTAIHCEMTLDKLNIKPDISICDVNTFTINKNGYVYHFEEIQEILEIKYCVEDNKADVKKKLKEDYFKLCGIIKNGYNSQLIVFDHKSHLTSEEIIKIQKENNDTQDNIKIIYVTLSDVICVENSQKVSLC